MRRSKMTNGRKKKGSDSDTEGEAEELSLISWLNLYQSFISDAADLLKDEINNINQRKIVRNESTLKNEKKPETVRLSQNIVMGFNNAISKAVKDLQGYGVQMTEELKTRFSLSENWKQSVSATVSVASSDDTESDSGRTVILPPPLSSKLKERLNSDDKNKKGDPAKSSDLVSEDDDEIVSQSMLSEQVIDEDDQMESTPKSIELFSDDDDKEGNPSKSPVLASDDDEMEGSPSKTLPLPNDMYDNEESPSKPIELFSDNDDGKVVPSKSTELASGDDDDDKIRSPSKSSKLARDGDVKPSPSKSSKLARDGDVKPSPSPSKSSKLARDDEVKSSPSKSSKLVTDKEISSKSNELIHDEEKTLNSIEVAGKEDDDKKPEPSKSSELATTDGDDMEGDPSNLSELVSEEVDIKQGPSKSSELVGADIKNEKKSCGEESKQKDNDKNKRTRRGKEEMDAMRAVLSDSDSEREDKRASKSPRKRENKRGSEKIIKQTLPSLDDPKLKGTACYVHLEKLSPKIEKQLEEESYVRLKDFGKMKKISLSELVKSHECADSDSNFDSDDSVKKLEKELAKLSKNSIIRTKKYSQKKKESGNTTPGKNTRRARRAAAREAEIIDLDSSDSDTTCDDKKSSVKVNDNLFSNCEVSGSGSDEDIDADSDESSSKKKKQSQTNPSRSSDRKRKTYLQATITSSSDSDEKQTMKDVLGSDSDTSRKEKKSRAKKGKDESNSDSDFVNTNKRVSKRKAKSSDSEISLISINSDSDDSDFVKSKRSSKRRRGRDSSSESRNRKKKRKRIVTPDSDDDSDKNESNDSDIEEIPQDEASSSQKGRKNIRKIMSNKELAKTTKEAEKEEEERRKRLVEKQKLFNGIHKAPESNQLERLVLDVDPETKEAVVEVDETIVRQLKPHQAEGIKFMYNACFESVDMIKQKKVPGGCILAHCMGLGKTLQSIAFVHTLLTNPICEIKTVLVICPLSTVNNWFNEFVNWTKEAPRINIHKLYEAKNTAASRVDSLKTWKRRGGVGILHYDIFRRLADPKGKSKIKASLKTAITETLLDPGPDVVICDEGHLLKNWKSMLSLAVNNIRTHRRVVLTGTPLQNNLVEYHTMMNFVKPNLLGSLPEFTNRFVNPIKNGQHADSTDHDVRTMKRRAHVLHRKLIDCVQRCDYSILAPYLPPKYEYIIKIKLSEKQELLYKYYLANVVDSDLIVRRRNLLKYYAELVKVWTHPIALTMRRSNKDEDDDTSDGGSLKDFIVDSSSESEESSSDGNKKKGKPPKKRTRAAAANDPNPENAVVPTLEEALQGNGWWNAVFKSKSEMQDCAISGKLVVLQEILKTSETIGDKVLVFSQYLSSLDIIEEFLEDWDKESVNQQKEKDEPITFPMTSTPQHGRWRKNIEYFRIDGQTKVQDRHRDCEKFNKKNTLSKAKLFLISTRAGGLGINLYGANRVVIFDASWNPSQDMQSIFRVYRFGQDKPCYIYRLIAQGTMEEKILRRQITKLSLSSRVVDEHQIERHFKFDDVNEMYRYDEEDPSVQDAVLAVPKDRLLADLLMSHREWIRAYEEFDSLLENKPDEGLTDEEKQLAWEEYRIESERQKQTTSSSSSAANEAATYVKVKTRMMTNYPHATEDQIETATRTSMDVIEKIRRLMLVQHSGGAVEHQLDPLKVWLQQAVSPRGEAPAPEIAQNGDILPPLPPAFYDVVGSISQYVPPRPRMNLNLINQNPQLLQHMSHNFRNIASSTLNGGMRMAYPPYQNQVNGHINRQNPY